MAQQASTSVLDRSNGKHLYLQVKSLIRQHLREGTYKPGDKLPSHRQLAQVSNVSQLTVQRAMRSLVREGFLYARRGQGTFARDPAGAVLTPKPQTGTYAAVVPSIVSNTVAIFAFALDGLIFSQSGHHMMVCNSQGDLDREVTLLDSLLDRSTDILIYQFNPLLYRRLIFLRAIETRLRKFQAAGTPVVMIDRFVRPDQFDTVSPDKDQIAEIQIRHLLELGHSRLLFVGFSDLSCEIIEGWNKALAGAGLDQDRVRMALVDGDDVVAGTAAALEKVMDDGWAFTAVVGATDEFALASYSYLKSRGVDCPQEVSIIGADNLEEVRLVDIHLTTVWSDPNEIAQQVLELINIRRERDGDLRGDEPVHIKVAPKLVVRGSTAHASVSMRAKQKAR